MLSLNIHLFKFSMNMFCCNVTNIINILFAIIKSVKQSEHKAGLKILYVAPPGTRTNK